MQETAVILMLKNMETGVLERELCTITVKGTEGLLTGMYVTDENGSSLAHMLMTTHPVRDIADWEYQAIYDYYDTDALTGTCGVVINEVQGYVNPVWDAAFPFTADENKLAEQAGKLLALHELELHSVYEAIKGLEGEYDAM